MRALVSKLGRQFRLIGGDMKHQSQDHPPCSLARPEQQQEEQGDGADGMLDTSTGHHFGMGLFCCVSHMHLTPVLTHILHRIG